MPNLAKRAYDPCIARKVRCEGALPCATCESSTRKVQCTYVRPAQKRGPKVRRSFSQKPPSYQKTPQATDERKTSALLRDAFGSIQTRGQLAVHPPHTVAFQPTPVLVDTIFKVIDEHENHWYSVWPVVRSKVLVDQLALRPSEESTFCLATALYAATIAQLNIPPLKFLQGASEYNDSEILS